MKMLAEREGNRTQLAVQPQGRWCELQIGHPVAVHFATVRDPQKRSVQQELLRPPRRIGLKGLKDRDNGVAIKKRSCTKGRVVQCA